MWCSSSARIASKTLADVMSCLARITSMPRRSRSIASSSISRSAWNISVTLWPTRTWKSRW
ncbi:hypothetical protein STENM327S_07633 [Streptomyces tendae]